MCVMAGFAFFGKVNPDSFWKVGNEGGWHKVSKGMETFSSA